MSTEAEKIDQIATDVRAIRRALERKPRAVLSKRAAAAFLGVDRKTTLQALIDEGKLRTVRVAGRTRVPLAELERIATEGTEPSPKIRGRRAGTSAPRARRNRAEIVRGVDERLRELGTAHAEAPQAEEE